ncbi:MAG: chorismate mutase [Alphaproteobacteria bacterium]
MAVRSSSHPGTLRLAQLREEIDAVDKTLHDLLLKRVGIVAKIRQVKGDSPALRPGREAQILRQLAERHAPYAQDGIALANLLHMWREMINALTAFQAPFSVGLFMGPLDGPTLRDVTRDHYGSYTALTQYPTPETALGAIRDNKNTLTVLPYPTKMRSWWKLLREPSYDRLRIVARLPFFVPENHRVMLEETGLVVAAFPPEPSGQDRTMVAIRLKIPPKNSQHLAQIIGDAWPGATLVTEANEDYLCLIDGPGFLDHAPEVPPALKMLAGARSSDIAILGSYATPLYQMPSESQR